MKSGHRPPPAPQFHRNTPRGDPAGIVGACPRTSRVWVCGLDACAAPRSLSIYIQPARLQGSAANPEPALSPIQAPHKA